MKVKQVLTGVRGFRSFSISSWIFKWVPQPGTNPVYALSIASLRYFLSFGMNRNSKNLTRGETITIGLNAFFEGIFGNSLFRAINLHSKDFLESKRVSFFQASHNKLAFFSSAKKS